jgi:hypothetical protein
MRDFLPPEARDEPGESELVEKVLILLEESEVPTEINNQIAALIEGWEKTRGAHS